MDPPPLLAGDNNDELETSLPTTALLMRACLPNPPRDSLIEGVFTLASESTLAQHEEEEDSTPSEEEEDEDLCEPLLVEVDLHHQQATTAPRGPPHHHHPSGISSLQVPRFTTTHIHVDHHRALCRCHSSREGTDLFLLWRGSCQAIVSMCKCGMGAAGSFSMPYAFDQGGLYTSFFLMLVLGFLCAYTVDLINRCETEVVRRLNCACEPDPPPGSSNNNNHSNIDPSKPFPVIKRVKKLTYPELGAALFPEATVYGFNLMSATIYIGKA